MNFPDRSHDPRIGSAAADVAAHALANFIGVQVSRADFSQVGGDIAGIASPGFLQKRDGGADLSWCAVAALKPIVFKERRLHRMQLIATRQTFYGGDLLAFMRQRQREAAIDAAAIRQNGACAALSVVATFLSAGEL